MDEPKINNKWAGGKPIDIRKKWAGGNEYENMSLDWHGTDTQELYQANLNKKKCYQLLKKNSWIDTDITYKFNSYGFRSDELTDVEILYNGCSNTLGVGLCLDDTWSKKVSDHFNIKHHNIAVGGSDNTFITQRSIYWVPKLKPKILVVKETIMQRYNWWGSDQSNMQSTAFGKTLDHSIVDISTNPANYEWHYFTFRKLLQNVCDENNVKLILLPNEQIAKVNDPDHDLARDLQHRGRKENQAIAKRVIDEIGNLV